MLNMDILLIFFNMEVYCVFSLESPHPVHTIYRFEYENRKSPLIIPNLQLSVFVPRDSRTSSKQPW